VSDEQAIAGGGLRVSFRRLADRYSHRIEWTLGGGGIAGLESVEGTADEAWPASPPLQELHFETREPGKQLALLVGRAGTSHWSVSIELDAEAGQVSFDVACRARSAPERLGNCYRPLAFAFDDRAHQSEERGVALCLPGGFRLLAERLDDRPSCRIDFQQGRVLLTPIASVAAQPQTLRWKYSITSASAADVQ
jgi:hypothetical protein